MVKQISEHAKKRVRKSPEQARSDILSAAESLLIEIGPDGLKLVDIAKRAGISHSLIIHHFGSMASLLGELALEIGKRFSAELDVLLEKVDFSGGQVRPIVDLIFDVYARPENVKLISWLFLTNQFDHRRQVSEQSENVANLLKQRLKQSGRQHLVTTEMISGIQTIAVMTAIGDAIGRKMLPETTVNNLPESQTRSWIAELIVKKLEI